MALATATGGRPYIVPTLARDLDNTRVVHIKPPIIAPVGQTTVTGMVAVDTGSTPVADYGLNYISLRTTSASGAQDAFLTVLAATGTAATGHPFLISAGMYGRCTVEFATAGLPAVGVTDQFFFGFSSAPSSATAPVVESATNHATIQLSGSGTINYSSDDGTTDVAAAASGEEFVVTVERTVEVFIPPIDTGETRHAYYYVDGILLGRTDVNALTATDTLQPWVSLKKTTGATVLDARITDLYWTSLTERA